MPGFLLLSAFPAHDELGVARCHVCGGVRFAGSAGETAAYLRQLRIAGLRPCAGCDPMRRALLESGDAEKGTYSPVPYVDRAGHLRQECGLVRKAALADTRSRVVPVWNSRRSHCRWQRTAGGAAVSWARRYFRGSGAARKTLVLLGRVNDASFFAYEIESLDPPQLLNGRDDSRICAWVASLLPPEEAGLLGYARQ